LNSRGDGASLRIDLFPYVRKKTCFRARVREPLLDVSHPRQDKNRALLIEYALLHDSLDSFSAQTEDEAFEYIIRQVMKNAPCAGNNEGVGE
jgi:hypothetical protein